MYNNEYGDWAQSPLKEKNKIYLLSTDSNYKKNFNLIILYEFHFFSNYCNN